MNTEDLALTRVSCDTVGGNQVITADLVGDMPKMDLYIE